MHYAPTRSWLVALITFSAIYVALYAVYLQIPDEVLMQEVYSHLIVTPGASLIKLVAPAEPVIGIGNELISGSTTVEIVRGCDGAGVLFLLIAAIFAVAAPLKRLAWGVAGALLLVYAVNQLRIVVLYFALLRHRDWFTPLHTMVFPGLFIVLGLISFLLWIPTRVDKSNEPPPAL
jgi:exosortase family protein XrtM